MFAPDGIFVTSTGVLTGPAAVERAVAARIASGYTKESTTVSEAHASGDTVWLVGEYSIVGSGQSAGKQIAGRYVKILTNDGSAWRIRTVISNLAPAAPSPAPASTSR
ncbi:MAG: hypothetical protein NVS2B3_10410 [Vulcanimicrobiaceae bacterium]